MPLKHEAPREAEKDPGHPIFGELFPGKKVSEDLMVEEHGTQEVHGWPDEPKAQKPEPHEDLSKDLTELKKSTQYIEEAAPAGGNNRFLTISPLSPSLVESDFYRIGPQGKHVDGWNGLIKQGTPLSCQETLLPFPDMMLRREQKSPNTAIP